VQYSMTDLFPRSYYRQLADDVSFLRQQLTTLMGTVAALAESRDSQMAVGAERTPASQITSPAYNSTTSQRTAPPRQPQFAGPTRAAFSLNIVESSLTRMGIPSDVQDSAGQSLSSVSSRDTTPEPTPVAQNLPGSEVEGLQGISNDEVIRLLGIYQEEVACVYPIIEMRDLITNTPQIMEIVRHPEQLPALQRLGKKDTHILRLAVATAITHEIPGKNDLSDRLVFEVEKDVGRISSETEVELKDIQIMGMLVSSSNQKKRFVN
jgi:predicted GNAT family N-acyltransferase